MIPLVPYVTLSLRGVDDGSSNSGALRISFLSVVRSPLDSAVRPIFYSTERDLRISDSTTSEQPTSEQPA